MGDLEKLAKWQFVGDTLRANARRNQSPGEGRYMVARRWSRVSGGTPGKRTNKPEPRLRGDIMRGLNMGQNTYNASIQCTTLCHPSRGSHIFLHISRGSAAYAAPRPGYFMAPLTGAQ